MDPFLTGVLLGQATMVVAYLISSVIDYLR